MDIAFEQKIRQRAYEIWMAAGMIDGAADEHWLLATNDICDEPKPVITAPVNAAAASGAAKAAPKAAKLKSPIKAAKAAKPGSKPAAKVARKAAVAEAHAGA